MFLWTAFFHIAFILAIRLHIVSAERSGLRGSSSSPQRRSAVEPRSCVIDSRDLSTRAARDNSTEPADSSPGKSRTNKRSAELEGIPPWIPQPVPDADSFPAVSQHLRPTRHAEEEASIWADVDRGGPLTVSLHPYASATLLVHGVEVALTTCRAPSQNLAAIDPCATRLRTLVADFHALHPGQRVHAYHLQPGRFAGRESERWTAAFAHRRDTVRRVLPGRVQYHDFAHGLEPMVRVVARRQGGAMCAQVQVDGWGVFTPRRLLSLGRGR